MRKTYYPGDIVAVMNVGSHYMVCDYQINSSGTIENYIFLNNQSEELKPSIQGQLFYVSHIDKQRGFLLLRFGNGCNFCFLPENIALYRRPLRNHIKALGLWIKYNFLLNKPTG